MAADFWSSSHYRRWIVDRITIGRARALDRLYVDDPESFDFLDIYFANAIMKLGRKLLLRQRVIATAIVFFKRFYLKNSYCETDPFLVIAACCYVASKAEECPVSIKVVTSEARSLFSQDNYNLKYTAFDQTRIAEMEFYLVDDLECDLTVFQPYRTLAALCKPDPSSSSGGGSSGPDPETEEGEAVEDDSLGVGGAGTGQLELPEGGFQHAWFIINDTYRSNLCLIYPPHLIAIAALYLTVVFHPSSRNEITPHLPSSRASAITTTTTTTTPSSTSPTPPNRRSNRLTHSTSPPTSSKNTTPPDTILTFLASMNVSLPLIATIMQEIISLWSLWDRYKEDAADASNGGGTLKSQSHPLAKTGVLLPLSPADRAIIVPSEPHHHAGGTKAEDETAVAVVVVVTPAMLSTLLVRMREANMAALVQTGTGTGTGTGLVDPSGSGSGTVVVGKATNKVLERAQAAG
ncbi:hypothetical protein APHAL10511_007934 [Amanita phalloides]|nr:hypothetical protein APHAL10511_007934 [Amanita phalloides]